MAEIVPFELADEKRYRRVLPKPRVIIKIDVIGTATEEYKEELITAAFEYGIDFPEYFHWVIQNPRGKKYGYYLVRERR